MISRCISGASTGAYVGSVCQRQQAAECVEQRQIEAAVAIAVASPASGGAGETTPFQDERDQSQNRAVTPLTGRVSARWRQEWWQYWQVERGDRAMWVVVQHLVATGIRLRPRSTTTTGPVNPADHVFCFIDARDHQIGARFRRVFIPLVCACWSKRCDEARAQGLQIIFRDWAEVSGGMAGY